MQAVYVRRRIGVAIVAMLVLSMFSSLFLGNNSVRPNETDQIVIMQGDTLWSLAEQFAPNSDPREWIYEVVELNSIDGAIQPGDRLTVPVYN